MTDPIQISPPSSGPSRSWRRAIILPILFFVGGIGATAWFLTSTDTGSGLIASPPPPIAVDPSRIAAAANPPSADVAARIAELETRLARAEAAPAGQGGGSTASDRVTGLVIAFAARRALERGQPLGPIEAELQAHFGASQAHLVAAVAAAAQRPVSLDQLRTEFDKISPSLSGSSDGWWARITGGLASLFTVRDAAQPSSDAATVLKRADAALEQGKVATALEEVAKLPSRAAANDWIDLAKRYVSATTALDALEASAFKGEATPAPPAIVLPEPDTMEPAPAPSPVF